MRQWTPNETGPVEEQRAARRLLSKMERSEAFAETWENFEQEYPDLPRWETACQRDNFAKTYRRLIGVAPADRATLRIALQEIVDCGAGHVSEVLAEINRQTQINRSGSLGVLSGCGSDSEMGRA
jgi:hypothetical protein